MPPEVPGEWHIVPGPDDQRWSAVEAADDETRFRANVVLTCVDNGSLSFRDWQAGNDALLPTQLEMYLLLGLERLTVAGHAGGRRPAEHVVDGTTPVIMEQWFAQVDGIGYTLTATVDSWRYDAMADFIAGMAAGLVLPAAQDCDDRGRSR